MFPPAGACAPCAAEAHGLQAWYSLPLEVARAVEVVGVNAVLGEHLLPQVRRARLGWFGLCLCVEWVGGRDRERVESVYLLSVDDVSSCKSIPACVTALNPKPLRPCPAACRGWRPGALAAPG